MPNWQLTVGSTTQSLAAWRINNVTLQRANLEADLLTFTAPRADFGEDPIAAFGDQVTLLRDAEVWFIGERQLVPAEASPQGEAQSYTFKGPWRWLDENVYQQEWFGGPSAALRFTSHCLLLGTIGENIKLILDYARANGANLQYVQAELNALEATPPPSEFTEKPCAAAILEQLHFAPDTIGWFEYDTTPPTLHFKPRSLLTETTVRLAHHTANPDNPVAENIQIIARPDLQVPSVKINGETINTINDVQYMVPSVDVHPPGSTGREDGAFNAVITLQGSTQTNVFAQLQCDTVRSALISWLRAHCDPLRDPRINLLGLVAGSVERLDANGNLIPPASQLPRELLAGQITDWMTLNNQPDGAPVTWQRETFRFKVNYEFNEVAGQSGAPLMGFKDQLFSFTIITTNAPDGISNYSAVASIESGDPSVIGLAQYLYNALNPLHYQGSLSLLQDECSGAVDMGNILFLAGSRAEYETMAALVQTVTFNLDAGKTTVSFGPPRHLTISDILALLQRFRTRRRWTNPAIQEDGEISSTTGDVTLGEATGSTNSLPGDGVTQLMVVKGTGGSITSNGNTKKFLIDFGDGKKVTIDAAAAAWLANKELKVVEYNVCVRINNQDVTRKALFIATDYYE